MIDHSVCLSEQQDCCGFASKAPSIEGAARHFVGQQAERNVEWLMLEFTPESNVGRDVTDHCNSQTLVTTWLELPESAVVVLH